MYIVPVRVGPHHDPAGYRQQYTPHYPTTHDLITDPSPSSRSKKKYTGGALTMHISSRLQSPPPPTPPLSALAMEEKFANPSERKARIDQLKDLVFNTRVKDTMVGRTDSKNRSTTNLHKANSYKRIDQITNPLDDYQSAMIPPVTPTRKDSHYYHYHLPSNTVSSGIHDNLNRPIVPPPPATTPSSSSTTGTSHPTYNYDYLRAKSKEHTRATYHEPNYVTSSAHSTEMPSSAQIGSSNSAYVGSALATNPLNAYRTFDDHGYIGKPSSIADKNSSYTSITSYPSYQTPGSSKRRIKKYLLAKGSSGSGLSHQTEPIVSNFENISLRDEEKVEDGDPSGVIISNTHATTPSPPPVTVSQQTPKSTTHAVPSLQSTPPIPPIPTLSPPSSPAPVPSGGSATVESVVFSTPNAQLSPSPPSTNINSYNTKIPPVIVVPLSASLTSLNKQQQALKSTGNSLLELVAAHNGKEQSPSRSVVPSMTDDGWEIRVLACVCVCVCVSRIFAVMLPRVEPGERGSDGVSSMLVHVSDLSHVFAVRQYHLARPPLLSRLLHRLNVIVGDGTIGMTRRRSAAKAIRRPRQQRRGHLAGPRVTRVALRHRNGIKKRSTPPTRITITLINDPPRHPIIE